MLSVGNADAFILWIKTSDNKDYVIFLDGGNSKDSENIINYFNFYIKRHLLDNTPLIVINTHPHNDHLNGLFGIVEYFKTKIVRVYYNNPKDYLYESYNILTEYYNLYKNNKDIKLIYESVSKLQDFEALIKMYGIPRYEIFSDIDTKQSLFTVVGPSKAFYISKVSLFGNVNNLKSYLRVNLNETIVNELLEGLMPCEIVDEKNDDSAENLTSTIIGLNSTSNRKFLFTSDSGIDSFESAESNGYNLSQYHYVQLPHHGSRRNINTNWISKFCPWQFWISAIGDNKHPRKAVIECIKKNIPTCKIYSTYKADGKSPSSLQITSDDTKYPNRGWSSAIPL